MKNLILLLLLFLTFTACTDKNDPESLLKGTWKLISMQSAWTGEVSEGSDMFYAQTYQFSKNGTFTKTQRSDDGNLQASGTYTTEPPPPNEYPDVKFYLHLIYTAGDSIAGDCYGTQKELLLYKNNKQIRNTWGEGDGSILTYKK